METTSYGELWRAFRKQNFGLCSTTYYSTVPITCTQTQIHRTQSLHYDKSLKCSSLRHIIATDFTVMIISWRCNKVSLERYLGKILWRLYRYLADLSFQRSAIHAMFRWYIGDKSWEQSAIFVDYRLYYFCTALYVFSMAPILCIFSMPLCPRSHNTTFIHLCLNPEMGVS